MHLSPKCNQIKGEVEVSFSSGRVVVSSDEEQTVVWKSRRGGGGGEGSGGVVNIHASVCTNIGLPEVQSLLPVFLYRI